VHLIRNMFRYASKSDWPAIAADLRPVYQAAIEAAARQRFEDFDEKWGRQYPATTRLWESAWAEFVPFLQFDPEIRAAVYSTNAIESIHARSRRAVRARGHFPTESGAFKCVYLTVRSLDPTGKGRERGMNR
jgi:transposase-like protein